VYITSPLACVCLPCRRCPWTHPWNRPRNRFRNWLLNKLHNRSAKPSWEPPTQRPTRTYSGRTSPAKLVTCRNRHRTFAERAPGVTIGRNHLGNHGRNCPKKPPEKPMLDAAPITYVCNMVRLLCCTLALRQQHAIRKYAMTCVALPLTGVCLPPLDLTRADRTCPRIRPWNRPRSRSRS